MDIQTAANLQELIEQDPLIELIEIWDKVLYIRKVKGRGRFHTKKNITLLKSGIYINTKYILQEYKRLQKKYHPDLNKGKKNYVEISKSINQWKDLLFECDERELNRTVYQLLITTCGPLTSIFSIGKSADFIWGQEAGFLHIPRFNSEQEFKEWKIPFRNWAEKLDDCRLPRSKRKFSDVEHYGVNERDLPF